MAHTRVMFRNLLFHGQFYRHDYGMILAYNLLAMKSRIRAWLFPVASVRQEITIEGCQLALKAGYHVKSSVDIHLLPIHIPDCRSYTVEYRLSETGEFGVLRDKGGKIGIRSNLDSRHLFPVCWLPRSFAGKRVDRYILMIDRNRVSYRAGVGHRRAA